MTHIFIHIHKSGGTTLMNTLNKVYQRKKIYEIEGKRYFESMKDFQNLPLSEKNKFNLIKGHQLYGVHNEIDKSFTYFSMLREPISRTVSLYNYLRKIDLYKEINQYDMDLITFLNSQLAFTADNGITRFLSGTSLNKAPFGHVNDTHVNIAKKNIENTFSCLGLTEEFDLSLLLFQRILGWKINPTYTNKNITKSNIIKKENLSKEEIEVLNSFLEPDIKLYNHVKNLFFKQVNIVFNNQQNKALTEFRELNNKNTRLKNSLNPFWRIFFNKLSL